MQPSQVPFPGPTAVATPSRPHHARGHVPDIRPFRALRYDPSVVDPGLVVAPPYDVIDGPARAALVARHPAQRRPTRPARGRARRRAGRSLSTRGADAGRWRSDGTLRKDPHPSVYVYEQTYRVPGTTVDRTQRGFFARLRLETYGTGQSSRTSAPWPARARTATSCFARRASTRARSSASMTIRQAMPGSAWRRSRRRAPTSRSIDDDGVRHRMWAVAADGEGASADAAAGLIAAASAGPVTIADGHHRYETALRYRDERRMTRSCEEDPAFDYLLAAPRRGGRAADRPADPSTGPVRRRCDRRGPVGARGRDCSTWSRSTERTISSRTSDPPRRRPAARAGSASGPAPAAPAARRSGGLRGPPADRRRGAARPGCHAPRRRPRAAARDRCRRGRRRRRRPTRSRRRRRSPPVDSGCADVAFLLEGTPGRRHRGRRSRRRRHAPEVDVLLSQGPDRPGHQSPRVVRRP